MLPFDQLLTTKLFVPPIRPGLVRRPRLLMKMNHGLEAGSRLTLITAPAGYGKTTLALEWLEGLGRPYAWLSLDREDNQPVQFLAYLIAALDQVDQNIGKAMGSIQPAPDEPDEAAWVQSRLTALINLLSALGSPLVMALDDYHTITDLAIHQALGFLLEHQPPQLHLTIISRQDPLLPLSKLRSRGQLTEIRLGELRFNRQESDVFLNETMKLGLLPEQVAALEARTEGWIAGLQLAALSLSEYPAGSNTPQDSRLRSRYIQDFTGNDRNVMDYLMDEVLSRQPLEIQRFLLHTSILKRLCGPLCDAVLGDWDIGKLGNGKLGNWETGKLGIDNQSTNLPFNQHINLPTYQSPSQKTLEYLERANLFIIPLDNHRQWYRYHHLFADLLSSRLRSSDPNLLAELHSRASQWYENAGMTAESVDHALLAEDFDRALRLIEHTASASIWASGELPVLLNWSRRLPEDVLLTRPRLCLYYARALFFSGQVEAADRYLEGAENALKRRTGADGTLEELWGVLFTNQATMRAMRGDCLAALELASQAHRRVPAEDNSTHARIAHAAGMAEYLRGDVRSAEAAFSQAVQLARQASNRNLGLDAVSCLALTQILSGRLREAERLCQEALVADAENRDSPPASAVYLALARVQYERNELQQAQAALKTGIALGRKAGWPHVLWQAFALQAQVRQGLGDPEGAQEALAQAGQVAARYALSRVSRNVSAYRARLELDQGNAELALRWAAEYRRQAPGEEQHDFEELTLARLLFSQGQPEQASDLLVHLERETGTAGRTAALIEALALHAIILDTLGDHEAAHEVLVRAIELAGPEGFSRVFLGEGQRMAGLISRVRRAKAPASVLRFSQALVSAFEGQQARETNAENPESTKRRDSQSPDTGSRLIEPLSERELEVLGLIAEGLSNPEIAARLYLSVNTLRAHTSNIYQKLDVHNRVQAVSRARELGLLPGDRTG